MNQSGKPLRAWYRRALSISLVISLVLIALGVLNALIPNFTFVAPLQITLPSLIGAGLVALASGVGLLIKNDKAWYLYSLIIYILLLATVAVGIVTAGNLSSPLVALWMLLAAASGMWGRPGVGVSFSAGIAFGIYALIIGALNEQSALVYFFAFLFTPLVSAMELRHYKALNRNDNAAYHALAQQLSQVANKSEIIINVIGEGVIAVDHTGVIELINPAAQIIMGWGKQDAMGLDYRSVFKLYDTNGDVVGDTGGPVQQVLNGDDSITRSDLLIMTNSGKKMNIWLQISSIGKFGNGAIIVFRDITNEVSENSQRAEFVSTASHEMRTPVAAIEGYLGLTLNPATAQIDDKARSYILKAHESAQHLGRLFQDLLDVSKADEGRLKNAPRPVEVVGFVREAVAIMTAKAQEKGLLLVFEPDVSEHSSATVTPIYYAFIDPDHLREVVSNLIDNALKYTREGSVTVNVTGSNEKILISLKDTGIGIAREDIPHLFQKFYRIDNTDTREIGGTGLGLYLCRRLVESMDGRIWVDSEQGKGSTFNVEIARMPAEKVQELQSGAGLQS